MKNLFYLFIAAFILGSCSNDDDNNGNNDGDPNTKTYDLVSASESSVNGKVTFERNEDGSATVEIELDGTSEGDMHPAHIHLNSVAEGGGIVVTLQPVDGDTGISTTVVSALDDETEITYEELLDYDGHVNVHLSEAEMGTIIAQGDVGVNELTDVSKTYELTSEGEDGVEGSLTITERLSGAALVEIDLEDTEDGAEHPVNIYTNSVLETGDIAISLNPVDGATGYSATHVESLDDDTDITYEELLEYDGHVNVHLSEDEMGTIIAWGDIGTNELTENSIVYDLESGVDETIFGTATFVERLSGETVVIIALEGTEAGGLHPAYLYTGTAADASEDVAISLNDVNGETGMSITHVGSLIDDTAIDFEGMIDIDGHIRVTESLISDDVIAQGDVGVNAE